jgi:hypothetical protein
LVGDELAQHGENHGEAIGQGLRGGVRGSGHALIWHRGDGVGKREKAGVGIILT